MNNSMKTISEAMTPMVDRISNLPDELVCYILSFLETKQAVATSTLSKQWKFLWTYVDILELDHKFDKYLCIDSEKYIRYTQIVQRVMKLHRAPLIKRMHLHCFLTKRDKDSYITWIQTALSKNVESLDLCFGSLYYEWPLGFFCSQTLVELSLENADITNMDIPTAPFFPNLKKLRLYLPYCDTNSLSRFIGGCSILEDFFLEDYSRFINGPGEACNIYSATLKKVHLHCCNCFTGGDKPKVVLNTPSLHEAYISMSGFMRIQVACTCNNLTRLEIMDGHFGLDILRIFMEKSNNLKVIILENWPSRKEYGVIWEEPEHVPKCLLSSLKMICIRGYETEAEVELMIKYILGNAKVLKSMEIHTSGSVEKVLKLHMLQKISMFPRISECEVSVL